RQPPRSARLDPRPARRVARGRPRSPHYGIRARGRRKLSGTHPPCARQSTMSNTVRQYLPMIQSVDRAISILKALATGPGRLGVSELSDRLGLAKGTVHGLLRTLAAHGLVEQHPDSDKYQLGPQLLQLSNRYLDLSELRSRSLAYSEALAGRADEAVRVCAFHGDGMLVVHHVFRPDTSLQILEVGSLLPLHATAPGKAVLAYLDEDVLVDLVGAEPAKLTGQTLVTAAALG